jgi:hypothetical protein
MNLLDRSNWWLIGVGSAVLVVTGLVVGLITGLTS